MMQDKIYLNTIPISIRRKIANEIIDTWFYEGNDAYFLLSHPMADKAMELIEAEKLLESK